MNRQNRRHPTHSLLPILYPSKKRIIEKKEINKTCKNPKGSNKKSPKNE